MATVARPTVASASRRLLHSRVGQATFSFCSRARSRVRSKAPDLRCQSARKNRALSKENRRHDKRREFQVVAEFEFSSERVKQGAIMRRPQAPSRGNAWTAPLGAVLGL